MAAMRRIRRSNKIPLNFVSRTRSRRPRIGVRREIVCVIPTPTLTSSDVSLAVEDREIPEEIICHENVVETGAVDVSAHSKRKEKLAEMWDSLRSSATQVLTEGFGLPEVKCCCEERATVRCLQCGPCSYFCPRCAVLQHKSSFFHHCPEVWNGVCFIPFDVPGLCFNQHLHLCDKQKPRSVTLFHIEGMPQTVSVTFCECEPDALTLMRLRYWPGTPKRPAVAFSFALMDWLELLLLECQVAVKDFATVLELRITASLRQMPCTIYPVLIDAFEEYRYYKGQIRSLKGVCENVSAACPACPKTEGTVTISIDGNFGLCRKKAAGSSSHGPLSGTKMFLDQSMVTNYITHYSCPTTVYRGTQQCSDFLAGNALRSNSRYSRLDETGVMGAACRHEYPICFLSLQHGERISYSVLLLEKLREKFRNHHIQFMYDIACTLKKHLMNAGRRDLLETVELAIPVFHAYGHKMACQIEFNPRSIPGFGLSDGEVLERLWSYLRRFSAMTKEMRPSHRIDVLTDALLHYARRTARNMSMLLNHSFM
ncbi:hypothetical protein GBAR_LOCUS12350 [Geodia barretti]|uniref:CxC1-like cysteine cluster associated with KDZ transposases domain-containing protein n=1 Tax=Geodia barretti TaxID=519541 RepID=A0AA35WHF3_GEOBA|nr:hypothetical protein GBAR_LOCUS12350 [Geodia barretti]